MFFILVEGTIIHPPLLPFNIQFIGLADSPPKYYLIYFSPFPLNQPTIVFPLDYNSLLNSSTYISFEPCKPLFLL